MKSVIEKILTVARCMLRSSVLATANKGNTSLQAKKPFSALVQCMTENHSSQGRGLSVCMQFLCKPSAAISM